MIMSGAGGQEEVSSSTLVVPCVSSSSSSVSFIKKRINRGSIRNREGVDEIAGTFAAIDSGGGETRAGSIKIENTDNNSSNISSSSFIHEEGIVRSDGNPGSVGFEVEVGDNVTTALSVLELVREEQKLRHKMKLGMSSFTIAPLQAPISRPRESSSSAISSSIAAAPSSSVASSSSSIDGRFVNSAEEAFSLSSLNPHEKVMEEYVQQKMLGNKSSDIASYSSSSSGGNSNSNSNSNSSSLKSSMSLEEDLLYKLPDDLKVANTVSNQSSSDKLASMAMVEVLLPSNFRNKNIELTEKERQRLRDERYQNKRGHSKNSNSAGGGGAVAIDLPTTTKHVKGGGFKRLHDPASYMIRQHDNFANRTSSDSQVMRDYIKRQKRHN